MSRVALVGQGVVMVVLALVAGCDSPVAPPGPVVSGGARSGSSSNAATGDAGVDDGATRPPPLVISESDFTESDRTRDPFRSFAREFVPVGPQVQVVENQIKLREYALDELRLVAVIVGTGVPYAMVVDPTGRGTIIRRGDYVGRPDTVASGGEGSIPHQVPWRVARIVGSRIRRDGDNNLIEVPGEVVFEREDRLNPGGGRAERVLSLTPAGQATRITSGTESSTASALPPLPGFGPGGLMLPPLSSATGRDAGTTGAGTPPGMLVQSYTTVIPPQPAPPPQPTTVIIQTGPQGQTTVTPSGSGSTGSASSSPQGPRDPYGPPPGGSNQPPPVQITSGPTYPTPPLPLSGLPR